MNDTTRSHEPLTPGGAADLVASIRNEIGRVIVGQIDLVEHVLLALLCEGHVLVEGVPGLGKTQLLRTLADTIDMPWSRVQFTPDLMPADIVGTDVLQTDDEGRRHLEFRPGPVETNLLLADEINRASPKTQSALLQAMQERMVTVAGRTRALPRPFLVLATQNPLEMEGTYPLPEAQLDRFLFKLVVPFPPADELVEIAHRTTAGATPEASAVCDDAAIRQLIDLTRRVPLPDDALRHAADLVVASHPDADAAPEAVRAYVRFGASPRAVQAMVLGAKARALVDGRPSAGSAHVRAVAPAVLRHRLVTGFDAVTDDIDGDTLVDALLDTIDPPAAGLRGT